MQSPLHLFNPYLHHSRISLSLAQFSHLLYLSLSVAGILPLIDVSSSSSSLLLERNVMKGSSE
ncbi:hypothetical protein Scep_026036 [Stephania cephalantha]|uniref:Uncharacterized protein n=1 Tax=Stephania cephalantha TaxID=152367 RepID=A0AAP0EML1_9MAGN